MSTLVSKKNPESELGDFTADRRLLLLSAIAAFIGVVSALVSKVLLWLIAVVTNIAFHHRFSSAQGSPETNHLGFAVILVCVTGGLIVGLMARYGTDKIRGHGIPEAIEAILIGRSRIDLKVAILKPLSSAIVIGTGGPFGAEGPIIMTGGACGSLIAQLFHLAPAERKTLLVAGAAGGMAAVFATPIAAVLLAVELLLFEWKPRSLIPVAVASIVAAVVRVPLLGSGPIFLIPPHVHITAPELGIGIGVGIVAGLGSCLLTILVYACEDLFRKLPMHWMWWPAIGAAIVGVGGVLEPRVLGVGYGTIHVLLLGQLIGPMLIGLLVAKALVWSISLGSGTSGGILAPLLMIGACLGAIEAHWLPVGDCGLWAMVSMTAVMAGTMRAPFTSVIFALELTHDLGAMPVVFVGCIAAVTVTVLLMKRSILTEKVARRGYHITREYSVDPFDLTRVADVVDTVQTVPATMKVKELAKRIAANDPAYTKHHALAVCDENGILAGVITKGDILRAVEDDTMVNSTVLDAGTSPPIVIFADELVHDALRSMLEHRIGRLIVVSREDPERPVGYIGRPGILQARMHHYNEENAREPGVLSQEHRKLIKTP